MSFQKIAAAVYRKQIAQEVVSAILIKRAAEQEEVQTSAPARSSRARLRRIQRINRRGGTAVRRGRETTSGEAPDPLLTSRPTSSVTYVSKQAPTYKSPGVAPAYGSAGFDDRMKAMRDNYLHYTYGRDPAIEKAQKEKVSWWSRLFGGRDSIRHKTVVADIPKFENEASKYSTYVKEGQTMNDVNMQKLINARAQEFAAHVVPDPQDVRGRQQAIAYFRAAANQSLNDWNYNQLQKKRPGEEYARARGPRNQGTHAVRGKFDFSGFTPEQIGTMERLGQVMLFDPDYEYRYTK